MGEDQRPWTNVCPELLDSIYKRLPSHVDGTHFGNVCKNWHRVHSRIALSNPLPVFIKRAKLTSSDVIQVQEGGRLLLQRRRESLIPHWLSGAEITIIGRAGAWFLIKVNDIYLGCYNPLLRTPADYIRLPQPSWHFSNSNCHHTPDTNIKIVFSALPTAPGSMILLVYADLYFSVLRRGKNGFEQKTYDFSLRGKKGQICLGVGYKDGRFFCLFEMGDMLIFSADKNEMRMLLAAIKPLLPEKLSRWNDLGVLAVVEKKVMTADDRYHEEQEMLVFITYWERDYEASEKDNFRLVGVDEQVMTTMRDLLFENDYEKAFLEDWSNKGFILVKEPLPLKMNLERCSLNMVLFIVSEVVLIFGFILILGFKN